MSKKILATILICLSLSCTHAQWDYIEESLNNIDRCINKAGRRYNQVILDPIFDRIYEQMRINYEKKKLKEKKKMEENITNH